MRLPEAHVAIIDERKVCDYLLSPAHVVGHTKARFFGRLGFTARNWRQFQTQLITLVQHADATATESNRLGQKYEVRGIIRALNGRVAGVVTVWIVRHGENRPRLVTVIPVALR